ncbi:MAG: hypothetical protein ACOYMG_13935 [Candidatus Methylumidiphilus sp.]
MLVAGIILLLFAGWIAYHYWGGHEQERGSLGVYAGQCVRDPYGNAVEEGSNTKCVSKWAHIMLVVKENQPPYWKWEGVVEYVLLALFVVGIPLRGFATNRKRRRNAIARNDRWDEKDTFSGFALTRSIIFLVVHTAYAWYAPFFIGEFWLHSPYWGVFLLSLGFIPFSLIEFWFFQFEGSLGFLWRRWVMWVFVITPTIFVMHVWVVPYFVESFRLALIAAASSSHFFVAGTAGNRQANLPH